MPWTMEERISLSAPPSAHFDAAVFHQEAGFAGIERVGLLAEGDPALEQSFEQGLSVSELACSVRTRAGRRRCRDRRA